MTQFKDLEIGREYYSTTTPDQEVLKVISKGEDSIIYEMCDHPNKLLDTYNRSEWKPHRWQPLMGNHAGYAGP